MHRTRIPFTVLIAVLLFLSGCSDSVPTVKYSHPGWKTLDLGGWTIQARDDYEVNIESGVDTKAGTLVSTKDSIEIHFDSWHETGADYEDCASHELEQNNESSLDFCEEFYKSETEHLVWTEVVNGRFAVYSRPRKTGIGTSSIHFSDCHYSLSMSAQNLTEEQEKIVFEMFATIDWKKDGTER